MQQQELARASSSIVVDLETAMDRSRAADLDIALLPAHVNAACVRDEVQQLCWRWNAELVDLVA